MTRRRLVAAAAAAAAFLILALPGRARADMHWINYYPGATINWYYGPYPWMWSWQNVHFPARDTFMTYGIGNGTYKIYYPTPNASGRYYYLTPKAGIAVEDTTAIIEVKLPDSSADVWFESFRTARDGPTRIFRSPALVVGRSYTYHVVALWGEGNTATKQERRIPVRAGDRLTIDFTAPPPPAK
ncbi:MAG TPA: TIGR03000 domain-containing protein [Gemmataceae bacterium]|nr:TIGR03000 domain-containing protein [Gemmataceae bacterium]